MLGVVVDRKVTVTALMWTNESQSAPSQPAISSAEPHTFGPHQTPPTAHAGGWWAAASAAPTTAPLRDARGEEGATTRAPMR